MKSRWYQKEAVDAAWGALSKRENGVIVIPTGGGKTPILSMLVRKIRDSYPHVRIAVLTHTKELVSQNAKTLERLNPEEVGIYCAALRKRDGHKPIVSASIQSIAKRSEEMPRFHLVIIDECHRIPVDGEGQYRTFLDAQKGMAEMDGKELFYIGLSATPFRMKTGLIYGDDQPFQKRIYTASIKQLIQEKYLSQLITPRQKSSDMSNVKVRAGEFVESEMERAFLDDVAAHAAIIAKHQDRLHKVIFTSGVAHAEAMMLKLKEHGVKAGIVHSKIKKQERDDTISRFRDGSLEAIVNVSVLVEGFDAPHVNLVAVCRATKSPGIFIQMAGRGLRTCEEKTDCLVLDFGGNLDRHGPIDQITPEKYEQQEEGQAPTKVCPECATEVYAACKECPECGYQFPDRERKLQLIASEADIFAEPKWTTVHNWTITEHTKGASKTMRVKYWLDKYGIESVSTFVAFESQSKYARGKAVTWWQQHANSGSMGICAIPKTVKEAVSLSENKLKKPSMVNVFREGKYLKILGYTWSQTYKSSNTTTTGDSLSCRLPPKANDPSSEDGKSSDTRPRLIRLLDSMAESRRIME